MGIIDQALARKVIAAIKKANLPYALLNDEYKSGLSVWAPGQYVLVEWRMPRHGVRIGDDTKLNKMAKAAAALEEAGFKVETDFQRRYGPQLSVTYGEEKSHG